MIVLICGCKDEGQNFADAVCECEDLSCVMNVYREFETRFPEAKSDFEQTERLPDDKKQHLRRAGECINKLNER